MDILKEIVIFIPCYNAEGTIIETLESISTSIEFCGHKLPIAIYDDCSTDNSIACINNYKNQNIDLQIYKNPANIGERATTNNAFETLSKTYDWVFIIHADDLVKPEWIKEICFVLDNYSEDKIFTIWSAYDSFNTVSKEIRKGKNTGIVTENKRSTTEAVYILSHITSWWHISGSAINLRLFNKIKGFDVSMPQYGDTDFFVRGVLLGFSDVHIGKILSSYRIANTGSVTGISNKSNRDIKEMFYILEKFKNILSTTDKRRILRLALKTTSRRSIKFLIFGKLKSLYHTTGLFNKIITQYISPDKK